MTQAVKTLNAFYIEYLKAAFSTVKPEWFAARHGLCSNLRQWYGDHDGDDKDMRDFYNARYQLNVEQDKLFAAAGLDEAFPFGSDEYEVGRCYGTQHKNVDRLRWVADHIVIDEYSVPSLKDFYLYWLVLANRTVVDEFQTKVGLCSMLPEYAGKMGYNKELSEYTTRRQVSYTQLDELYNEQVQLFHSAGLDISHPFGDEEYHLGRVRRMQHKDPLRLAWAADHA